MLNSVQSPAEDYSMSQILLSIILPCRNEFPHAVFTFHDIMNCIEADGIDPKSVECILVNNCSDDSRYPQRGTGGTTDYLLGRGAFHNRVIRMIYDPIAGNHSARNKGARIARGKYLFFSDGHMSYKPGFFKSILATVDKYGGLVHGSLQFMGAYPPTEKSMGYQYTWKLGEECKQCVDEKTELLTTEGWKKWNEVNMKTIFATPNMKTHEIEFQKPKDIIIKNREAEMIEIKGRSYDALLTPYHRAIYQTPWISKWRIKEAKDISSTDLLPIGSEGIKKTKSIYSDEMVELIGWIITEGSYDNRDRTITIVQYNLKNRAHIESCLKKCNLTYYIHGKRKDIRIPNRVAPEIKKILPRKELTFDFLNKLNRIQLEKLYKVMIDADGWRTKTNESFIQLNRTTIDAFQYLCVLIGKASKHYIRTVAEYKGKHHGKNDMNIVSVKKNKRATNFSLKKVEYKGIVWCPELKNGTIVCRRSGHVYLSGNTWANYKLADTPWFIIGQGAWGMACTREEFFRLGGYEDPHRTYGGEFYISSKAWMMGSTVMVDPNAIGYHLASGRGYTYDHNDYKTNILGLLYALGADDWRERTYLNYLRKTNKEALDAIMAQGEVEYAKDRAFIARNAKYSFNELLTERPWEKLNIQLHGSNNAGMLVFHWSWLELLKDDRMKEAYLNSKYQQQLGEFIETKLTPYIYHHGDYVKKYGEKLIQLRKDLLTN